MQLKLEILPQEQREIYPYLKQITEMDFVLFGGTAIALQLGHRISIDFDFFNIKNINDIKSKLTKLQGLEAKEILQNEHNTLVFTTNNGVKISFFGDIEFANKNNANLSSDNVLYLAKMDILLATKLKVICDRAEYKDYKDIAEILKTNQSTLDKGIELLRKFFGNEIPNIQLLKTLTYFEDGDLHRLDKNDREILTKYASQYEIKQKSHKQPKQKPKKLESKKNLGMGR